MRRRAISLLFVTASVASAGCSSETADIPVSPSPEVGATGAAISDESERMLWAWKNGAKAVDRGMTPDEVFAALGEPSVRDMSDSESINGQTETLSCWIYEHPDNPTDQDRTLQVCFRVDPERGGTLFWAKRRTGTS